MQHSTKILSSLASFLLSTNLIAAEVASAPNGLELPENYQDWKVISQSHRLDIIPYVLSLEMMLQSPRLVMIRLIRD